MQVLYVEPRAYVDPGVCKQNQDLHMNPSSFGHSGLPELPAQLLACGQLWTAVVYLSFQRLIRPLPTASMDFLKASALLPPMDSLVASPCGFSRTQMFSSKVSALLRQQTPSPTNGVVFRVQPCEAVQSPAFYLMAPARCTGRAPHTSPFSILLPKLFRSCNRLSFRPQRFTFQI
ncbi:hypothetical protein STEG23_017037 [Scotinomys teguina]